MTVTDIQRHSCGYGAAHTPHPSRTLIGWWCPGIMPLWPCGRHPRHPAHEVTDGNFYCPGTVEPPRNMTGPWYSTVDVCAAIEKTQEIDEDTEELEQ